MNETTLLDLYERSAALLAFGDPGAVPTDVTGLTVGEFRALLDTAEASLRSIDWNQVLTLIDRVQPGSLTGEERALLESFAAGDFSDAITGIEQLRAELAGLPDDQIIGTILGEPVGGGDPDPVDVPAALAWAQSPEGRAFLSSPIYEIDFATGTWSLQNPGGLGAGDGAAGTGLAALYASLAANLQAAFVDLLAEFEEGFRAAFEAEPTAAARIEAYHAAVFGGLVGLFTGSGIEDAGARVDAAAEALGADGNLSLAELVLLGAVRVSEISSFDFTVAVPEDGALRGTELRDALLGSAEADVIDLGGGADTALGGAGDDMFMGGTGDGADDRFAGEEGTDTLRYDLGRAQVAVSLAGDGSVSVAIGSETDSARTVERIELSDGAYLYGLGEDAPFVYRLYSIAFGRTPDEDGLRFWEAADDRGLGTGAVAEAFRQSAEFSDRFGGPDPESGEYVAALYTNVLGRDPRGTGDQGGFDFWKGRIDSGELTEAQVLEAFALSGEFAEATAADVDDGLWVTIA